MPAYARELEFPSEPIIIEISKDDIINKSPSSKVKETVSSDEESKDSALSFLSTPVDEATYREGVSSGFFSKIPPIDGHSHFENL